LQIPISGTKKDVSNEIWMSHLSARDNAFIYTHQIKEGNEQRSSHSLRSVPLPNQKAQTFQRVVFSTLGWVLTKAKLAKITIREVVCGLIK